MGEVIRIEFGEEDQSQNQRKEETEEEREATEQQRPEDECDRELTQKENAKWARQVEQERECNPEEKSWIHRAAPEFCPACQEDLSLHVWVGNWRKRERRIIRRIIHFGKRRRTW